MKTHSGVSLFKLPYGVALNVFKQVKKLASGCHLRDAKVVEGDLSASFVDQEKWRKDEETDMKI